MTISSRNRLLIASAAATVPILVALMAVFMEVFNAGRATLAGATVRFAVVATFPGGFVIPPSAAAVALSIPVSVLYATLTIGAMLYFFEKTQAPEILFFAFFALSLASEALRCSVPLALVREWPPAIADVASRGITFGRLYGSLALFAASVYANGIEFQKHGRVLIIIGIAALAVATGLPIDGQTYDTSFMPTSGYRSMMTTAEASIAVISVASFLVAGYARSSREYSLVAVGVSLVFVGRELLVKGDSWVTMPAGVALLAAGTWITAAQTHRYYMWL